MEHFARLEGSNEFFARKHLYNAKCKLRAGDRFRAGKILELALLCVRSGGVSDGTAMRIMDLEYRLREKEETAA